MFLLLFWRISQWVDNFAAAGGQTEAAWSATETAALHAALWVATGVCVAAAVAASLRGRG